MTTHTVSELASICGATLQGDGERVLAGPATLRSAAEDQVAFFANPRYKADLEETQAGAVVVALDTALHRTDLTLLRCEDPNTAFSAIIMAFMPPDGAPASGVSPSAIVEESARVAPSASIGALCHVGAGAELGEGVVLHSGVMVGAGARVGAGTVLYPSVVLYAGVEVGADCTIHAGTTIGSDGFGFEPTGAGWKKIPQCGTVIVGDRVEMGANCTIDRGRFGATRISDGAKLDNQVHLAHNVEVEADVLLVAQTGVAGSSRIEKGAILAGQTGVSGHLTVGAGARVGAQSGVTRSVPPGEDYTGMPARPRFEQLRSVAMARGIPDMLRRLKELEQKLEELLEDGAQ